MKVLKFGGTSVGSIESILEVKKIVESQQESVIVVVSAFKQVTDQLYHLAQLASQGDATYQHEFQELSQRHISIIEHVVEPEKRTSQTTKITQMMEELSNILRGIFLIHDLTPKITDTITSYGERASASIIGAVIDEAITFDSRQFIKTVPQFTKHIVDFETTNALIREHFRHELPIVVCGGFISTDKKTGNVTNLGRGGSDYTAAILAAALNASSLEIWTDVDGFMTADPRIIDNTYVIEKLTFTEAMELCNFGAKVIYPPTIYPAYHKNIPIRIKNTFNPTAPGTYISCEKSNDVGKSIKGISSINDTCLITVQGLGMVGVIGVNYRIFKALAKAGISVFLVSQASSENNTSFAVKNSDAELAVKVLDIEFEKEIEQGEMNHALAEKDLATVAIVGENMKRTPGIAGKLFGTLGRNGINVIACAQGASETNISFVTDHKSLRKALNVIHDSFFLSDYQVLNVFLVGTGTVGGSLLEQIRQQQPNLMVQKGLKLNVVGIANAEYALFDREGIQLDKYQELLLTNGKPTSPQLLCDEILGMNIFNSVFVDCTASPEVATIYKELLSNNVSVVAANKIAASSEYATYAELKSIAGKRGIKFLFETNVGAGLPIMNTINNLINSGDRILKMEAVLSGTLNFIFNTLSAENTLSKTIRLAKEAGYSEPDPRIDLSGKDVIRKLLILTREAGYKIEQEDVACNLFIPDRFFEGTLNDFWNTIGELDGEFEHRRQRLETEHKRLRFVAKMEEGQCSVGLQEVDMHHPLYDLEGSNNILMLTTERYNDYPMIIKGYGAGANVTAAGVFADIISIANIR
ncbi:bifunctional aspartate kinase/homoserine dehydrogenase I [Microbacter margulisiae]|uniref:Aspartokinase/homoserine dehydrogenase 1 n=1 Tax=Microbacter margulisiae TaxID=1350067 RepID=A0A7W5DMX9_9PORP|nr:bifunctional aspartate kinase/homoserine dehydrogenase I [Microbacter margulisiae]MBB3185877.1 aspartokinase/homoserine dehydrogenase 1 [Microbacter margulisiae]